MEPDTTLAYLDFVTERHRIWEHRQAGDPQPWTDDPVLLERKFTNVFRVLDPGSQFVLTDLLPDVRDSPRDFLARCLLYRFTNRPETWWRMREILGRYPLADDLNEDLMDILTQWRDFAGGQVFSGAYLIMPEPGVRGVDKARSVVKLARRVVDISWEGFSSTSRQARRYEHLSLMTGMGDFMSQQVLTDYGYGFPTDPAEDFVVAGPGARLGASYLTGTKAQHSAQLTIRWAREAIQQLPDAPTLSTPSGPRAPSCMDVQNTLCEFSKYLRFQKKPRTGRPYRPAHPGAQPAPVLPLHW